MRGTGHPRASCSTCAARGVDQPLTGNADGRHGLVAVGGGADGGGRGRREVLPDVEIREHDIAAA